MAVRLRSPRSKYNAQPTTIDGIKFPSKKEARYYAILKQLVDEKKVLYFLRQVPIHLPANIRYVCDFVVFYPDGSVRYIDSKGVKTPIYILKKKQVESLYPIRIEEQI